MVHTPPEFFPLARTILGRWPDAPEAWPHLLAQAHAAGLGALLAMQAPGYLPAALQAKLKQAHRQAAAQHLLRLAHWQILQDWLQQQGLEPLVLKGAALAYTHYPDPATRPHTDIDLLLPPHSRAQVEAGLRRLGYQYHLTLGDTPISTQCTYLHQGHAYDLHWTVSNSPFISLQVGSYAALRQRAVYVPALGAYTLAAADALRHACLHWAQHHKRDEQRLIWLYDLVLLVQQMSPETAQDFRQSMHQQQLEALCQAAIRQALALFPIPLNDAWHVWLHRIPQPEPSLALLQGSPWQQLGLDWQALPTVAARRAWLRAYLLPPRAYMQARYPHTPPQWLWWQYVRRLFLR